MEIAICVAEVGAAYTHLGRFQDKVYMPQRIHPSLGCLTLAKFEARWLAQHTDSEPVFT